MLNNIDKPTATACWIVMLLMVCNCAGKPHPPETDRYEVVRGLISTSIAGGAPRQTRSDTLSNRTEQLAARFYRRHDYHPAWIDQECRPRLDRIKALHTALQHTAQEGLDPNDYALQRGKTGCTGLSPDVKTSRCTQVGLARMDVALTRAFFTAALDLLYGRIDPTNLAASTTPVLKETDLTRHFELALQDDRFESVFESLTPNHGHYRDLRRALANYRQIAAAGGWPRISEGPLLKPGGTDSRIPKLYERLKIENPDLKAEYAGNRYTDGLAREVRHSQHRYGLIPDGVVGPATLTALNQSVETRIRQIEVNLERWRWLPLYFGERYMVVNIADFRLYVVENDRRVLSMRAVVGNNYRQTPVFSATLNRLVLNPYWFVPHRLAVEDILPVLQKDPAYIERQGIAVFSGWGDEARRVDTETIDWTKLSAGDFGYVLRQAPGPANPLGRVKFVFPNLHDVYIHDTPLTGQFRKFTRTFSSGCIRVEKPVDLAAYLLWGNTDWTRKRILAVIATGASQMVWLGKPLPVHLTYWTAFADDRGVVHFRDDIYQRDRQLEAALTRISLDRKKRFRWPSTSVPTADP